MAAISWKAAVSGDWDTATDWNTDTVPGPDDDVSIQVAGDYVVSIDKAEAAASLTLDAAHATIVNTGSFTVDGAITLTAGTLLLSQGVIGGGTLYIGGSGVLESSDSATISHETIGAAGGVFTFSDGTLDGVTVDGTLDLAGEAARVTVTSAGLIMRNAGGTGSGVIELSGDGPHMFFEGSQNLSHTTIVLDADVAELQFLQVTNTNATVVLGPDVTIDANAPGSRDGFVSAVGTQASVRVVNEGTINTRGGEFQVGGAFSAQLFTLTNAGNITVSAGGQFDMQDGAILTNFSGGTLSRGVFEAEANSKFQLVATDNVVTDDATIILSGAGSIFEGGAMLESTLATIGRSGTLEVLAGRGWSSSSSLTNEGVLDVAGGVFDAAGLNDLSGSVLRGFGDVACSVTDAGNISVTRGHALTLSGTTVFDSGALVNGLGRLTLTQATVAGLTVGEAVTMIDAGQVEQTGNILLRRNAKAARLIVDNDAIWRLDGDVGMARRMSENPEITVDGTFVKSAGSGVSAVGVYVEDDGVAEAATGTLDFKAGVTGTGTLKVDAGATLECDRAVDAGLSARFTGAGATLALKDPSAFAATIGGFAAGDAIDLLGIAATSAVLGAGDILVITNGSATVATLQLTGDYSGAAFSTASDGQGGTSITVSTAPRAGLPAAAKTLHPFIAAAASFGAIGGGAHLMVLAHAERPHSPLAAPRMQAV